MEQPEAENTESHLAHTYQDDLAQVMNVTEAPVVQEMLNEARERQIVEEEEIVEHHQEKWYSITGLVMVVLTIAVVLGGIYYYMHLTIPVHPAVSVGVFENTDTVAINTTSIDQFITSLVGTGASPLPIGKPLLVNLVTDTKTNALVTDTQLFSFMQAQAPEPLQSVMSSVRLGVVNTGSNGVVPFIIASIPNPQKASQEFSNDEPTLLGLFYKALNIDPGIYQANMTQPFQSQYFYNLPVRTISTAPAINSQQTIIFLYGYVNNNTLVITSKPEVMDDIYNNLLNQT